MKTIRATEAQVRAIRNLMLNQDQISLVLERMQAYGAQWLSGLEIGQAKELISNLVQNMRRWKS
ncbi:hypothetical protein Thermo_01723 [Thermoplasmatales archaeon]|nr:hypothetical protein Thermo_01723 [Thermoplasmatales archaeon]